MPYYIVSECYLCGTINKHAQHNLCNDCFNDLPWIHHACLTCGLPQFEPVIRCGHCQSQTPVINQTFCALRYDSPVNQLLAHFKYQRHINLAIPMAAALIKQLHCCESRHAQWQRPDLFIAIPLHWQRQCYRGFNQSQVIATILAEKLNIAVDHNGLLRHKKTPRQQHLGKAKRSLNMKNTFTCRADVQGRHIALVDDVITTGATINSAAEVLVAHGATSVTAVAIARTPSI